MSQLGFNTIRRDIQARGAEAGAGAESEACNWTVQRLRALSPVTLSAVWASD